MSFSLIGAVIDVKVLRLVTGEWLIAECSGESGLDATGLLEEVCLKNPCLIGITPEGIAMGPLSPFSENKEVTIRRMHILFFDTPSMEFRNGYASQFGGITLPGTALPGPGLDLGLG